MMGVAASLGELQQPPPHHPFTAHALPLLERVFVPAMVCISIHPSLRPSRPPAVEMATRSSQGSTEASQGCRLHILPRFLLLVDSSPGPPSPHRFPFAVPSSLIVGRRSIPTTCMDEWVMGSGG